MSGYRTCTDSGTQCGWHDCLQQKQSSLRRWFPTIIALSLAHRQIVACSWAQYWSTAMRDTDIMRKYHRRWSLLLYRTVWREHFPLALTGTSRKHDFSDCRVPEAPLSDGLYSFTESHVGEAFTSVECTVTELPDTAWNVYFFDCSAAEALSFDDFQAFLERHAARCLHW